MKTRQYRKIEKAVAAHDGGGIWERWRYGRLLLVDDEKTTPNGNLRHGVLDALIAAAKSDGLALNMQEIQRRVRAARTYPTEDQMRIQVTHFETWEDLVQAGFPDVPAPDDARPYDPRETDDLLSDHESRGARLLRNADQLAFDLFPKHDSDDTLGELERYATEQSEITARYVARDARRREYLDQLIEVVGGDLTKTLGQAQALLHESEAS